MNQHAERIVNGMIKENPTFVLMLECVLRLQ